MSTLICSRISSATSRCCRASFAAKALPQSSAVSSAVLQSSKVSRGGLHQLVSTSAPPPPSSSADVLRRFLASTASTPDADFLRCWNCNEDFSHCVHSMIACSTCNSIRVPPPTHKIEFFDLFDLPRSFDIDVKILAHKFKSLQRLFHPDVFAQRSQKEKSLSENWSSIINEAYSTLLKPHKRANYLLQLYGKPIEEGEMSMEPEFLLEIMELNEEIYDAETRPAVESLLSRITENMIELESLVSGAFRRKDVDAARKVVSKLQYFVNLRDQLVKKETELGIIR